MVAAMAAGVGMSMAACDADTNTALGVQEVCTNGVDDDDEGGMEDKKREGYF